MLCPAGLKEALGQSLSDLSPALALLPGGQGGMWGHTSRPCTHANTVVRQLFPRL